MPIEVNAKLFGISAKFLKHAIVRGCNRSPFTCNFRGHALGYLAGSSAIDQNVELRLTLDVDESGRNHKSFCIDAFFCRGLLQITDRGNTIALDSDVAIEPRSSCAIDNACAGDDEVVSRALGKASITGEQDCKQKKRDFRLSDHCAWMILHHQSH